MNALISLHINDINDTRVAPPQVCNIPRMSSVQALTASP